MASPDQQLLDIKQQLAALQEKVNYMYDHLTSGSPGGIPPMGAAGPSGISPEVIDLVRRGQQLEAIKLYRSQTGASLSDAKAAIDGL